MNRNQNSHFAKNPANVEMSRSRFDRSHSVKTSFNVGQIVPFYVDEVLPGDTFSVDTSKVVRFQTLLTPIMDNIYLDTYYFFVPNRLVWSHWREFNGENTSGPWAQLTEYSVPQVSAPSGGWSVGTIADYMGIPTGVSGFSVNALPFRAYALIMQEWFRDENLCDPLAIPLDDTTVAGSNGNDAVTDVAKGGQPYRAAKYHDYFTSALPSPQKGPDVTIPVTQAGLSPVYSLLREHSSVDVPPGEGYSPVKWWAENWTPGVSPGIFMASPENPNAQSITSQSALPPTGRSNVVAPLNLWAYNSGSVSAASINQLRLAFQIQKLYERDARGGTRYIEILKSHFGVTSPDSRLQRPEYLGGNRIPININQVIQNSATQSGSTPLGDTAGMSVTSDVHSDFTHSFVEHGFLIGVCVARYDHTYQQGLERFWSRKQRFDYYWPVFANIGEQAVKNKEIYLQGNAKDDEVFGYQEAWADYRYKPSHVTGQMRSSYPQSLDVWHLADDYASLPSLSPSWIFEDAANVDRVLAVTSSVSNQLFADFYIRNKASRVMPLYSIPGLIDHH